MKKLKNFKNLICSFSVVLILLWNGTVLHAQVENRLKAEGRRLKATNQKTGCREQQANNRKTELSSEGQIQQQAKLTTNYNNQTTGYRLQDKNRLKAEGYRLKETESLTKDNREAELASGDQVEQGGKSTTNYQLPTTNCNNQGVNLDCCLMMNPATLEEGVEALRERLGICGKRVTITEITNTASQATRVDVALVKGEGTERGSQSAFSTDFNFKAKDRKEREQDCKQKIIAHLLLEDSCFINPLNSLTSKFLNICSSPPLEALNQGNQNLASLWLKTAKQYKELTEYYRQVVNKRSSGNTTDLNPFYNSNTPATDTANQLEETSAAVEKETKAEEVNLDELAALWLKIAKQYEESAEYYGKAINAILSRNFIDCERFYTASKFAEYSACRFKRASNAFEKSTKATEVKQGDLTAMWLKTTEQWHSSAEYYRQAANTAASRDDTYLDGTLYTTLYNYDQIATAASHSAYQLKEASNALEKAIKAKEENQEEEAKQWQEKAKQYKESADRLAPPLGQGESIN
ncbi:MAG: hypothetical protein A3F67_06660 [Verrucomicrobia bacterium RIFCSPHIGHO2_12_FULL_41_10]|nr:MAG: hypothetical protein A3F67_06660 [Verrucomicrobia bacterium RIFCSPHIGHO2_12_FULL_41_10]HLB34448.1 hypothetical protein [Chthoniobacterales bacterium]